MNVFSWAKNVSPIVKNISTEPRFNDEPYFCFLKALVKEGKTAGAVDFFNKKGVIFKLIGEILERFYLKPDYKKIFYTTPSAFLKKNKIIIPPQDFVSFLAFKKYFQLENKEISKRRLGWVKGISIISGKETFVPAQLVFVPYRLKKNEPLIGPIISTGASCHSSLKKAITNGLLEVIERDAFMIMYLNKTCRGVIDVSFSFKCRKIFSIFKKYNLEPYAIDISTDVPVYSVLGILIDRTGIGPAVSVGAKSSFDLEEAILGAFGEAMRGRLNGRTILMKKNVKDEIKKEEKIKTFRERSIFWSPIKNIAKLEFFWKNKKISYKKIRATQKVKKLESLLKWFKEKNYEVIYVDLTPSHLKKEKIFIVKVLVPQFQPLYLDERFPVWEGPRLKEVPKILGLKHSQKINTFPHPFL